MIYPARRGCVGRPVGVVIPVAANVTADCNFPAALVRTSGKYTHIPDDLPVRHHANNVVLVSAQNWNPQSRRFTPNPLVPLDPEILAYISRTSEKGHRRDRKTKPSLRPGF